jgi:hypothetical protein
MIKPGKGLVKLRHFVFDYKSYIILRQRYTGGNTLSKKKLTGLTDKYWITDFNYLDEVRRQFNLPERVYIHDVTLREAEQSPHVALRPDEKIRIFEALDDMGVHSVEVFPIISPEDKEMSKELVKMPRQAKVFFLCRWNEWEVDFALEAGADGRCYC